MIIRPLNVVKKKKVKKEKRQKIELTKDEPLIYNYQNLFCYNLYVTLL